MKKIEFKNGQDGGTPINATNLNAMQDNAESEINKIITALTNNKATVTGENITINDSAEARVEEIHIRGNSVQDGTPTPESPVEINSCGDNVNLFDKDTIVNGGLNSTTGVVVSSSAWKVSDYIPVIGNKTYCLHWESDNSYFQVTVCYYDSSKIFISGKEINKSNTYSNTFTTVEGTSYIRFTYSFKLSGIEYIRKNIKLEEGTEATVYSPYNQGNINETICNKNLFDKNKAITNGDNNQNIFLDNIRGLAKDKNYTAYANSKGWLLVREYNSSNELVATYGGNTESNVIANFTPKSDNNYFTMQFYGGSNNINLATYDFTNVMIVEGTYTKSNLPTYIEHKSQTYTIPTQKPFRAIGEYKDTFIKQDGVWYEKHYIKEVVLDGDESNLSRQSTGTSGKYRFVLATDDIKYLSTSKSLILCNYLSALGDGDTYKPVEGIANGRNNRNIYMYLEKCSAMSFDAFKTWLASNNIVINYVLEIPELIPCTTEQIIKLNEIQALAKTYKNTTHIFSEDEVGPEIEVTYLKDIATMLGGAE